MIQLHYYPGNANLIPHILLRELDIPFELVKVDRDHGAHRSAAYLALNPNGTIPVLVDGDLVLYETAAICLHLADRALVGPAPDGRSDQALAPALGTPERAHYYKWMAWMTNTLQAMLIHYYYPDRMVAAGNAEGAEQFSVERRRVSDRSVGQPGPRDRRRQVVAAHRRRDQAHAVGGDQPDERIVERTVAQNGNTTIAGHDRHVGERPERLRIGLVDRCRSEGARCGRLGRRRRLVRSRRCARRGR